MMTPSPPPVMETISDLPLAWIGLLGGVLGALIGAAVAALLTYLFARRQIVRNERREAYTKFLKFLDHIPTDIIFEVSDAEDIGTVAPRMIRSMKDSEIELELIQSTEVCRAVDALYEVLIESNTAGLLANVSLERIKRGENVSDLVMGYRDAIAHSRTMLVQAMRKDLGVKPLPDEHFSPESVSDSEV